MLIKSSPFPPPEINRSRFRSWRKKICVFTEKVKILYVQNFTHDSIVQEAEWCSLF